MVNLYQDKTKTTETLNMEKTNSKKGFINSMLALILFILAIVINFFTNSKSSDFLALTIGMLAIVSFVIAILGLVNSIRGLSEPISMEQIVGITVNGIFTVVFVFAAVEIANRI